MTERKRYEETTMSNPGLRAEKHVLYKEERERSRCIAGWRAGTYGKDEAEWCDSVEIGGRSGEVR